MKLKKNIFLLLLILLIIFGCETETPLTEDDAKIINQLIYQFNNFELEDLDVNSSTPNNIVVLSKNGKVFLTTNSGKNFNEIISASVSSLKFDDYTSKNTLFLGLTGGTLLVTQDFGNSFVETGHPDIATINKIYIPPVDSFIYAARKSGNIYTTFNYLFKFNRYNFNWEFLNTFFDIIHEYTQTQLGTILDISSKTYQNKHLIFVSEETLGGIVLTEDNFKTFKFLHINPKVYFVKHSFSNKSNFSLALIKANRNSDGKLYYSEDFFRNITPIRNNLLDNLNITDFEIIN